jgi:hypothetical protein
MLSDWRLGARTVDTSNQCLVHLPGYYYTELPKAYIYEWDLWLGASSGTSGPAPSGVTLIPTSFPVVELTSYHHGHKGARHRCVQLRWWPLPDLPIAPPRGPAIDVSIFGGDGCQTCFQHPPGVLPSMSPSLVLAAARPTASTPKGPAIDISNSGGGRCRTCRQHPLGGPPSTSPTSVVAATGPAASTPRGPPSTSPTLVVAAAGPAASTPQGACHRRVQQRW